MATTRRAAAPRRQENNGGLIYGALRAGRASFLSLSVIHLKKGQEAGAVGNAVAEIFSDRLAHVGESGANAEVVASVLGGGEGEDRNVLARMVGGFPARIGV